MKVRNWILPGILVVALIAAAVWGYNQYSIKNEFETALNNSYQRLFYDLKAHVDNVQVSLSKVMLADSKEQNVILLSQIMQQAYMAEEKLGQMPVSHSEIAKTEKFLNQVADYCFAMSENSLEGKPPNQEQRQALTDLQQYTEYLTKELSELHGKIMEGSLSINAIRRKKKQELNKANENMLNTRLIQLEEKMTSYPELIYDGPFSDQVMNIKPKGLGDKKFSSDEAKKIAIEFLGQLGRKETSNGTMLEEGEQMDKTARIPSYTFSFDSKNTEVPPIYIGVSKTGGNVVWLENVRNVTNPKLSMEEAQKKAGEFLSKVGYDNMEPNYSLKYDGIGLFNFAYKQGDVTIYTDLIKVKVALDNGEIVGIDAAQYLKSHHKRDLPEPNITQEEAGGRIKTNFDIENVRLAVIPRSGVEEVFCYEFKGQYNGSDFIVYVDALTGQETKILKIIKDENGTLTF